MGSLLKWMLVAVALFVASGNAHAFAAHAAPKAEACASQHQGDAHHHHRSPAIPAHDDCCCSCFSCPSNLAPPFAAGPARPGHYAENLMPSLASPLASRFLSPELDPPRPGALS